MISKNFGDHFVEDITQGYRLKITHGLRVVIFGNKDNGDVVDMRGKVTSFEPCNAFVENFKTTKVPKSLKESRV